MFILYCVVNNKIVFMYIIQGVRENSKISDRKIIYQFLDK